MACVVLEGTFSFETSSEMLEDKNPTKLLFFNLDLPLDATGAVSRLLF